MTEKQGKNQKRIILGITGGIAAYKAAELARLLIKKNYIVIPMMTPSGAKFLGSVTIEALTGNPVYIDAVESSRTIEHVSIPQNADLFITAPLTANTMAKFANGIADNFLTAAYLAYQGPRLLCPAMNSVMFESPATQRNLAVLKTDGAFMLFGSDGELACGTSGKGRMAEPEVISDAADMLLAPKKQGIKNKMVLVTAGPTFEDIDPVRYLGNKSSGKMGIATAKAFRDAGAEVTLIHGPIHEPLPHHIKCIPIRSAEEMAKAVFSTSETMDIIVMAAAVADFAPDFCAQKIKKQSFSGQLQLNKTKDILKILGSMKKENQLITGFAAESTDLRNNALKKLKSKKVDLLFANDISQKESGFDSDTNALIVYDAAAESRPVELPKQSKSELAERIVDIIAEKMNTD